MDEKVVLKFGGSSVADNQKLNIVANKIIDFYKKTKKVIVVVSAQGKTTDRLIQEANELSSNPNHREMDVLLSTGEQITISKLAILLNELGYEAISLTGWQAGINTDENNQDSKIIDIETSRIEKELNEGKIVIIAGFQGINNNLDITTLGRGGSDTTAVAIAAAVKAKECYIFSDVEGIYTADPNKIDNAKKLEKISYEEMLEISSEGARVLHNRCVDVGKKYNIPIIAKSTFNDKPGSIIQEGIEETKIKSIIQNNNISRISFVGNGIINNNNALKTIIEIINEENLKMLNLDVNSSKISIVFTSKIPDYILKKFHDKLIN